MKRMYFIEENNQRGFTLIEMLVVIAIIAILKADRQAAQQRQLVLP